MNGPRDQPVQFGVPVDIETGQVLTARQGAHLHNIKVAVEGLYEAMHNAEGSTMPGEHQEHEFQTRRMKIAATHIETAIMFARKATLETP